MGCLVGQENKKKTHKDLARNILHINENLKPHLHIVDGLIAMEGLGPTRGRPKNMGLIIIGTDPYLIDLLCAKIAQFNNRQITTLKLAEDKGLITKSHHEYIQHLDLTTLSSKFEKPKANILVSFVHSPKRQKYFLAIRNTKFFSYLASTKLFGNILFWTGLRQDNFIKEEMVFEGLILNKTLCKDECTKCMDYCPLGLKLPQEIERQDNNCIECLYCFLVCPTKAIEFKGRLGFMAEQLRQYDELTRKVT
jgi:ferredoxin